MTTLTDTAGVYADFSGLNELRADARRDADGSAERVARQFESLFVQMMLKSMRDATPESGLFGGSTRTFTDMFDRQISLDLTAERGIGLANMIVPIRGTAPVSPHGAELRLSRTLSRPPAPAAAVRGEDAVPAASARAAAGAVEVPSVFEKPEDFVQALAPYARRAGAALGVDPKILLAQAALETGWGRHVMRAEDGRAANNFFGIKADERWDGDRVRVSTLESLGGVLERVRSDFRAYPSPADSFRDYVDFISGHGRYATVLSVANDPAAYVRGLQDAGYATDPRYADKILDIFGRRELAAMMARREPADILGEVF